VNVYEICYAPGRGAIKKSEKKGGEKEMKKILFPILALVLALGLVLPAVAHTEDDPFVTDLIAGQHIDAGDVKVWNDGTNLYVQYVTTGGWVLTETHLHVATSMEGIPQNNGNPPPGQFDYASEYDPSEGVTEPDPYVIPLADLGVADPCDPTMLYIAAHAVVAKLGETQTTCVVSDNSTLITKVYNKAGGGNAEVDLSGAPMNAVEAYEPKPYPTVYPLEPPETIDSVWDNGVNWFEDNSSSADWIWDTHHAEDPASYNITDPLYDANAARWGRVVLLETDLDIPGIPTLATLHIAADNAYEFWLNSGTSTRSATAKVAGWESTNLTEAKVATAGWQALGTYDVLGDLIMGSNTLYVLAGNEYFWGDDSPNFDNPTRLDPYAQYNPGAAIFQLCVEWVGIEEETAWGDGSDFPGKNWAMYFTYETQCPCVSGSVINGDFEAPVVTHSSGWNIFPSGTPGLGWTVEWASSYAGAPTPANLELHHGVNGWLPYDGDQHAELDTDWGGPGHPQSGEQASVKIYQDIDTCPGRTYTLSYAWSPRPGHGNNKLEVYWDGSLIATHSGAGGANTNWTLETPTVSATGYTTTLAFIETGTADSLGMFLDAVSLVEQ